jgi:hypothetical protein
MNDDFTTPVTNGFDAPADYFADSDIAELAKAVFALRGTGFFNSVAAELIEAVDGDVATASAVLRLAGRATSAEEVA